MKMARLPVEVVYLDRRGQPASVKYVMKTDFETKMKLMYVVKQHALFTTKGQKIQDKLNAEVDFWNGTFIIKGLTIGCNIDTYLSEMTAIILEDTDNLVLNEVPVTGLDGEDVCSSILKSEFGQIGKIYPDFDQENNGCYFVYEKGFGRQAEECINSSVMKMVKERDASKYTEQITLSIVFSEVFNTDGMEVKLKRYHPQVTCEMTDCELEDLLILRLSGDENKVKDAQLWIETEYEHKFAVNNFGFREVKQGQKVGDELSDIVERKCLSLKVKNSNLFFYINSETSQITICTTDQKSADLASTSLKKCLKETEFNTDCISKPEKIRQFKQFAKNLEQDNCTVTIKGNVVCVVGLKDDVERAETCFKEILTEARSIDTAKWANYQQIPDVRKEKILPCHIIVKNLPHTVDEDHIQLLFENDKKQGGGEVVSVQLNEDKTVAVVEFEDPKAVDIVLNKRPIKIKGLVVDVEVYVSSQATNDDLLEDGSDSFPSLDRGHEEFFAFICTICDDKGNVRQALFHCETCGAHYCRNCSEGHTLYVKGHTVLGPEEKERWGKSKPGLKQEFECEEHKQQLAMYCENHDLVCCAVCAAVKHRSECDGKVFYIPEIAGKVIKEQEFCEFKEHIDRALVDVTRKTEQKQRFDSTLQPLKTKYRERVKQFMNRINKAVELLQDKSFTEIDNVLDEIDSKTKSEVSACVEIKKELNRIQKQVTNSDDMLKFIAMKTSRTDLQELQSKLAGVEEEEEKIVFQMDQTVLKRVEALSSLCTVKMVKRH